MEYITEIYLIRHSIQHRLNGKKNISEDSQLSNEKTILSVEGEKRAEEMSQIPQLKDIDVLWSSNYVRAISTAKYIAINNNIEINIDENLNERKLREFRKIKEIRY